MHLFDFLRLFLLLVLKLSCALLCSNLCPCYFLDRRLLFCFISYRLSSLRSSFLLSFLVFLQLPRSFCSFLISHSRSPSLQRRSCQLKRVLGRLAFGRFVVTHLLYTYAIRDSDHRCPPSVWMSSPALFETDTAGSLVESETIVAGASLLTLKTTQHPAASTASTTALSSASLTQSAPPLPAIVSSLQPLSLCYRPATQDSS